MTTNSESLFWSELTEHESVLTKVRASLGDPFNAMLDAWSQAVRGEHTIFFFGNGGSAADAQHLAAELVGRYKSNRRAIAALALTTDSSILTAVANDFGYDQVFARQLEALGRPGDLAVGISTSGRSQNVILGLQRARDLGLDTSAFTGGDGGELPAVARSMLVVPSHSTARIQEMHIMLGHMLCLALERELGLSE